MCPRMFEMKKFCVFFLLFSAVLWALPLTGQDKPASRSTPAEISKAAVNLSLFLAASSATPLNDLSSYAHLVKLNGTVETVTDPLLNRKVYSFAKGGYLEIPDHSVLDYALGGSMTIEINVRVSNFNSAQVIMDKGNLPVANGPYSRNYGFSYTTNVAPGPLKSFNYFLGGITGGMHNATVTISDTWFVLTLRLSKLTDKDCLVEKFVNGKQYERELWTAADTSNDYPLYIGTGFSTSSSWDIEPFTGYIDYVRIYQGLLPDEEINKDPLGPVPGISRVAVSITSPAAGASLSGTTTIEASASADKGVSKVEFYVDGTLKGTDTSSPYNQALDTTALTNGSHTLKAIAYDTTANTAEHQINVTVTNGTDKPPTVAITSPAAGATVKGTTAIAATASDDKGVVKVEFYVDDVLKGTDTSSPYSCDWDAKTAADGLHAIKVQAEDTIGQKTSATISVTVNNTSSAVNLSLFLAASVATPWNDLSSYAHLVKLNGTVETVTDSLLNRKVYSFAKGGYLEIPDHTVLDYMPDGSMTIEINVRVPDLVSAQVIMDKGNLPVANGPYFRNYGFKYSTDIAPAPLKSFNYISGGITGGMHDGTMTISDTWFVLTLRLSKLTEKDCLIEKFVNGKRYGQDLWTAADTSNDYPLYIGTGFSTLPSSWNVEPFTGYIDYVRIYQGLLPDEEINKDPLGPVPGISRVSVSITSPTAGASIYGTTTVQASASADKGVSKVEFYADGTLKGTDTAAPFSLSLDTTTMTNGSHAIKAKAYDTAGSTAEHQINIIVSNGEDPPPTVAITSPAAGATVKGTAAITATASADKGVVKVEFYVDDVLKGTDTSSPYSCDWDTKTAADGLHTIKVQAEDTIGQKTSATINVTVNNTSALFQVDLSGAAVIFVDYNKKLRKIIPNGVAFSVINTDPDVVQIQWDPNRNLFIVFSQKQKMDDGNSYLMVKVDPKTNAVTGIDKDLSLMFLNSQTVSPNIQFDGAGNIYYLGREQSGKLILRKYVSASDITDLINDNISIRHWHVKSNGTIILAGTTLSTSTSWLRRFTPGEGLKNIAVPADVGWIKEFPDGRVYVGIWGAAPLYGVYRLTGDLAYIDNTAALIPFIGLKNMAGVTYAPENDAAALAQGLDPIYCAGFANTAGTYLAGFDRTRDSKVFGLASSGTSKTIVRYYPNKPEIVLFNLVDRVTLFKQSLGQLIVPGTRSGVNKLLVADLAAKTEINIMYEDIEIYHLDILSDGSILFDGLKFANNKYVAGMFERAAVAAVAELVPGQSPRIAGYTYKELSELGGKPIEFLAMGAEMTPTAQIAFSKSRLDYGAVVGAVSTQSQSVVISNAGTGTINWAAESDKSWLSVSPPSGTGTGIIQAGVNPAGLAAGTYTGTITVSSTNATNSPQSIAVQLVIKGVGTSLPPFGEFSTPVDGTRSATGAIPVTGWVVDDVEVVSVKIYRDPASGEGTGLVFIGDAIFVEGARPDIEIGYPGYPMNYKAGWGYMLLTNFLPSGGNGAYKLHAFATDKEGNQVLLGSKTIICSNNAAVKPFGTIDTPVQGGDAPGSLFVNFGWVLTPMPKTVPTDGSTIDVYVDSVKVGNLATAPNVYNQYRVDVATAFPGLNNSGGPVGAYYLNTTTYANGVHTIHWIATDNQGAADGIGSRYFNVVNTGAAPIQNGGTPSLRVPDFSTNRHREERSDAAISKIEDILNLPMTFDPLQLKTGFDLKAEPAALTPDNYGVYHITIPELNRMEIDLRRELEALGGVTGTSQYTGYALVGDKVRPLPIGSTLDTKTGTFSWIPGPGFVGSFDLVFVEKNASGPTRSIKVKVTIKPKF